MVNNDTSLNLEWLGHLSDFDLQNKALSPDAVVVYSPALDRVIWANVSGAKLFGGTSINNFITARVQSGHPFLQQLKAAVRQLGDERIYRGFRVVNEGHSRFLQCEIGLVELGRSSQYESGERAIIVSCSNPLMEELPEHEFARLVLDNLADLGSVRAIFDEFGLVIAATDKFAETGIPPQSMEIACSGMADKSHAMLSVENEFDESVILNLYLLNAAPKRLLALADDPSVDVEEMVRLDHDDEAGDPGNVEEQPETHSQPIEPAIGQAIGQAEENLATLNPGTNSDIGPSAPPGTPKGFVGGMVAGVSAASSALFRRQDTADREDAPEFDPELRPEIQDEEPELPGDAKSENESKSTDEIDVPADLYEDAVGSSSDQRSIDEPKTDTDEREKKFVFSGEIEPVRFAWITDTEQVFTALSPELASAVGPNAADIVGRKWNDVATVFGFDNNGELHELLKKQDTWSGKTVLWPVQGTDLLVPVDLAALPSFSSGRNFEGFRGFGIIRMLDTVVDPEETGLALVNDQPKTGANESLPDGEAGASLSVSSVNTDNSSQNQGDADSPDHATNIVELDVHREPGIDAANPVESEDPELTKRENHAFDEIGRKLRDSYRNGAAQSQGEDENSQNDDFANQPDQEIAGSERTKSGDHSVEADTDCDVVDETPRRRVDTSLLSGLPVPVMVYRGRETLFANQELLNLTGYADFHELSQAGGIDVLFDQDSSRSISDENEIILRDRDGGRIQVKALLQSVPWDEKGALLLSFRLPKHEKLPANEKIVLDMMRVSELHNILDTATDGIIILDPEGIVQSINQPAQALFGRSDDEMSGKSVNELFAIESHNRIAEYLSNLGSPDSESLLNDGCEVIGVEAKGGLIPLYVTIGNISASDKYCAILRDMTPWKKSREELVEARKQAEFASEQKTEFLTRVSHEIRTPLNAIIGFSDVMIEERFGPVNNNRYREYLRDINRSGVHVLDLINDLLDISKIEAGKMELSFEAVDLNRIVGETVALLQPQANGDRVLIRTSLSRAVPKVVADARSIRQIVLNLVSNAIKFTDANGQVIVSTVYEGNGEVALRVRDTGRGMSDEEVVVALKPFRQINTMRETRGQGTGLGLPLTKALVDANKAYLDIESEPGEGTIVHIQFPTQRVLAD